MNRYSQLSISQLPCEYLNHNRALREATRNKTRTALRHLENALGDMKVADITFFEAQRFQGHLARACKSPASVNGYVKTVRPVINWARTGSREPDPFKGLRSLPEPREIRTFSRDELVKMVQAASPRMALAIILASTTGLRRGELLNLTYDDILIDAGLAYIREKHDTRDTWAWDPKRYYTEPLPLSPRVADLLMLIRPALPVCQPYPIIPAKTYLSLRGRIGTLDWETRNCPDRNINRSFDNLLRRANVPKKGRSFQECRKTCVTQWTRAGDKLAIQDVQRLARHASLQTTTSYYAQVRPDAIEKARDVSIV